MAPPAVSSGETNPRTYPGRAMLLFILAYLGGVLTILSPCILPVLPFVFARADRPFVESGLPMLIGMAATFALVATLAAVGGGWAVTANEYGRFAALALLALFGVALIFPSISERLTRPLVALGDRLSQNALAGEGRSSLLPSLLLGVATGLLWAPCAGPILGLILTGAAIQGASVGTTILLLAYAAGAATSLALALLVGGRVFAAMKGSLGVGEWVRRGLGVAMVGAVAAIAFGLRHRRADARLGRRHGIARAEARRQVHADTRARQTARRLSMAPTALRSRSPSKARCRRSPAPRQWLNSPPLTREA